MTAECSHTDPLRGATWIGAVTRRLLLASPTGGLTLVRVELILIKLDLPPGRSSPTCVPIRPAACADEPLEAGGG